MLTVKKPNWQSETERTDFHAHKKCEKSPVSYQNCQPLATFYTIYYHMFPSENLSEVRAEKVIDDYGTTEQVTFCFQYAEKIQKRSGISLMNLC